MLTLGLIFLLIPIAAALASVLLDKPHGRHRYPVLIERMFGLMFILGAVLFLFGVIAFGWKYLP